MKAQNCPLCGLKAKMIKEWKNTCRCPGTNCYLAIIRYPIDTWNRIRIAPDDKEVEDNDGDYYLGGMTDAEDWMNPKFEKQ